MGIFLSPEREVKGKLEKKKLKKGENTWTSSDDQGPTLTLSLCGGWRVHMFIHQRTQVP